MGNEVKLQPVSVRSLGLPPEAAAQISAIARQGGTEDLDTTAEFFGAKEYLNRLVRGFNQALTQLKPRPIPSEGSSVIANDNRGPLRFWIQEHRQGKTAEILIAGDETSLYHYFSGPRHHYNKELGLPLKLVSDGEHVFALFENLTEGDNGNYIALLLDQNTRFNEPQLAKPSSDLFLEIGGYERVKKFKLEDIYLVDGQVNGLYWDPEGRQYLELPLYTDSCWDRGEI